MYKIIHLDCNSLESGNLQGRVLEVVYNAENFEKTTPENTLNILVLVEDKVYSLKINNDLEVSMGDFISFNLNESNFVEDIKTQKIPFKFKSNGDVTRWRKPSKMPSRMQIIRIRHKIMREVREWFNKKKFIELKLLS